MAEPLRGVSVLQRNLQRVEAADDGQQSVGLGVAAAQPINCRIADFYPYGIFRRQQSSRDIRHEVAEPVYVYNPAV